ncbi:erythrocyte membrane protein band [Limosa lapponica baueri]|uniref:Erythrocyte membrane protein band n=1 Tax=Limosa lapponica baueri TaxID=1758121 RepID=A0A2I0TNE3_LIMLA|nr:erythrocyte membrane protein band [Limosa lapponica baueri]
MTLDIVLCLQGLSRLERELVHSPRPGNTIQWVAGFRCYSPRTKQRIISVWPCICQSHQRRFISTKAVGSNSRVDVTCNYKYPEVKDIPFKISYSQYKNSLTDDRKILVTAVCKTKQGASLLVEKDIILQDPFLTIEISMSMSGMWRIQSSVNTCLDLDEVFQKQQCKNLGDQKQWSAAVEEQDPCFWTISVNTPANAPIGHYTLLLHASKAHCLLGNFTLLFNPWCKDDEVFLANEAQRQEYILNQEGIIYWGTENAVLAQPWDFSQFEEHIVDICFLLLDVGERRQRNKDHSQRKSPVHICRTVAAMVWIQKADDTLKPAFGGTKYTGNNISTKSVGSERCEDITHDYKYPEGSLQEKEVLDKAYRKIRKLETTSSSSETQFTFTPTAFEEPVNLFIHLQSKSSLTLGQDVPLSIEVFNHSGGEKATHLVVGVQSLHYNGVPITQLWKEEFHFTLRSNEGWAPWNLTAAKSCKSHSPPSKQGPEDSLRISPAFNSTT